MKGPLTICLAFVGSTSVSSASIHPEDPGTFPASITVRFKSSAEATFNLVKGVAQSIDFNVGGRAYTASLIGCTPVEHVQFDTALLSQGEPKYRQDGRFTLVVWMGAEKDRAFGVLPAIQISFEHGQLARRAITREVAPNSGFTSDLCPPAKPD
jgi:hypothetical protein